MSKTILVTGSTDGIGFDTVKRLLRHGHRVLIHGRSATKLAAAKMALTEAFPEAALETYQADLLVFEEVITLAATISERHGTLDVLINNAGVFNVPDATTGDGLDVRFAVNTIAPYLLTRRLLPLMEGKGRVVNLSSAAQAPVDLAALTGPATLSANAAYAQSKLALTMWSRDLAHTLGTSGPVIVAVNPGSFLATKMVREAYGMAGENVDKGAEILERAALAPSFAEASGRYYDNDAGRFAQGHPDATNPGKCKNLTAALDNFLQTRRML